MVQELRLVSGNPVRSATVPARVARGPRDGHGNAAQTGDGSASATLLEALSREVRTTLALVSGYSQSLLHLDLDDEERDRCLTRISVASAHVAELTEEMLSVAASKNDGRPICQPVTIGSLLSHLGYQLAEEADPPRLDAQVPAELPLVSADPVWIVRVLRNLVASAAGSSADGRSARLTACSTGEWVVVSIQGAEEALRKAAPVAGSSVGSKRSRTATSPTASTRSVGTYGRRVDLPERPVDDLSALPGIDYCRQLVEAHGGRIWLDETSSGMRVSFSLPRYWAEEMPVERRGVDSLAGAFEL
jgi:K+-sensing histidine kinase KdpD